MNGALRIQPGSRELAKRHRERSTVAIDLGFAKATKSCGVAWRGDRAAGTATLTFGTCIKKTVELLSLSDDANLVLEAPLSGFFSLAGNPVERGQFERRDAPPGAKGQTRYWYSGPGAATCLAAVFFLRELLAQLEAARSSARALSITLFEGFLTFKAATSRHDLDARILLDAFLADGEEVVDLAIPSTCTCISVLDVVSPVAGSHSAPPALIVPTAARISALSREYPPSLEPLIEAVFEFMHTSATPIPELKRSSLRKMFRRLLFKPREYWRALSEGIITRAELRSALLAHTQTHIKDATGVFVSTEAVDMGLRSRFEFALFDGRIAEQEDAC